MPIKEELGDRVGAANSWDQLAQVMQLTGKPVDAEAWYRKALAARQAERDRDSEARTLNNLAVLLREQPGRLPEARSLAERALALVADLDPVAGQIWKIHNLLATIADREDRPDAARDHRRRARAAYAAAPRARETLRLDRPLVAAVAAAAADPGLRPELEETLEARVQRGWHKLVAALRRVLAGERDEDALCDGLDWEDTLIVGAVLRGIADPATLKADGPSGEAAGDTGADAAASQLLERHLPLIRAITSAATQPDLRPGFDSVLEQLQQKGWGALVAALRRVLEGERRPGELLAGLDEEDSLIVAAVLAGLENPAALQGPN